VVKRGRQVKSVEIHVMSFYPAAHADTASLSEIELFGRA
jgi:hypothetical protein